MNQYTYPATHAGLIWHQTTVTGNLEGGNVKSADLVFSGMRFCQNRNPCSRFGNDRTQQQAFPVPPNYNNTGRNSF